MASRTSLSSAVVSLRFPAWQRAYEATLQATDQAALFKLVEVAESAMLVRRDLLNGVSNHSDERSALDEALRVVSGIKRERLLFSNDQLD